MEFEPSADQRLLQERFRAFLAEEIAPEAAATERAGGLLDRAVLERLARFSLPAALVPEAHGGLGLDFVSYCLLAEELSRAWPALRTLVTTSAMLARLVADRGTPAQRARVLPGLLTHERLGCFAITEPNVGSDVRGVETRAVRQGDHYALTGTKTLITGGSLADVALVFARVPGVETGGGITAFLVERVESPFGASDIPKMGMHASPLSELVFDACRVPVENRVGEEGEGLRIALHGLSEGRVNVAFAALGLGQAALDAASAYARERRQFGRPIAAFQLVQEMIVQMAMKVEIARLLALRAAARVDAGLDCRREASFAKLYATEAMLEVASTAIQVHGGYGYTAEYPVERYYRDLRHLTLAEGTTQIQTLILGRELLGVSAIA